MPSIIVLTLLIFAAGGSSVRLAMAQESGATRFMAGDRVTVTVFGQADLSGTFQVDGSGFIELPLIGAVSVKQLTPKECEAKIGERLADGYLNRPVVSVSIGEVRPIYVLGDVRTPGAYAFRYGFSVLSAIAQAGGYGAEIGGTISDFLVADERVRLLDGSRRALLIRLARLEAQLEGTTTFVPPSFVAAEPENKFAEVVANEREALRIQRDALDKELTLQRQQKPRLEASRVSIEQQIESEKKQLAMVADQLGDMEQLMNKGLALRSREVTIRREQAALDSNISRYRSELARLAVTIGELDIRINDALTSYQRRVHAELDDVRRRVKELDTTIPSAREVRDVRSQQVTNASGSGQAAPTYRIVLSRNVGDEVKTLPATGETMLQPGDVVEVRRLRPENKPVVKGSALGLPSALPQGGNLADGQDDPSRRIQ